MTDAPVRWYKPSCCGRCVSCKCQNQETQDVDVDRLFVMGYEREEFIQRMAQEDEHD